MMGFCLQQEVDSTADLKNCCTTLDHLKGRTPSSFACSEL